MGKIFSFKNLFILSIILIMFLFLKDDGLIDYQRLANERNQLLSTIQDESNSLYDLQKENERFKNDPIYIEKIAREKWFFRFPNETIINF
tara:strand:- start:783 stop:1052 length:270 start_codon:yes stop_codon:yes gene_type:complete